MRPIFTLSALGTLALVLAGCADETAGPAATAETQAETAAAAETAPAYDATGQLQCSAANASFDQSCDYKVRRTAAGAMIEVTKPGGDPASPRVMTFANGSFATQGVGLRQQRRGADWMVGTEDRAEFYLVPGAALSGG